MKKFFLAFLLSITCIGMRAQMRAHVEPFVGIGASSLLSSGEGNGFKTAFAWKAGAGVSFYPERGGFCVNPALAITDYAFQDKAISGMLHRYACDFSLMLGYNARLGDSNRLSVLAGPYVSVGVSGSDVDEDGYVYNVYDQFDRVEAGIQASLKLNFGGFNIGPEFNYSIKKQTNMPYYDYNTFAVFLNFGYIIR